MNTTLGPESMPGSALPVMPNTTFVPHDFKNWTDYGMAAVCMAIFVVGLLLNITLVIGTLRDKMYRSVIHMYILNLAIADIMIVGATAFFPTLDFIHSSWSLGPQGCQIYEMCRDCVTPVILFTLAALSYERSKAITLIGSTKIRQHQNHMITIMILSMWLVSVLTMIPMMKFGELDLEQYKFSDPWVCILDRYEYLKPKELVIIRCAITYQIPLAIIAYNYCVICWKLCSISNHPGRYRDILAMDRSRRRALARARIIFFLIIAFVGCSFPSHFFRWLYLFAETEIKPHTTFWNNWRTAGFFMFYAYPTLGPVFLYLTSQKYHQMFNRYLFCLKKKKVRVSTRAGNISCISDNVRIYRPQNREDSVSPDEVSISHILRLQAPSFRKISV